MISFFEAEKMPSQSERVCAMLGDTTIQNKMYERCVIMFDCECAKELILDLQIQFPEAFEEVLHKNGYANLFRSLDADDKAVRLAAIGAFQAMPDVDDCGALDVVAEYGPDEEVREAAREAIGGRAKE